MRRDEINLADERPSRLSRVAVLVVTVGVALITVWVLVPIVLANYAPSTATPVAAPKRRAMVQEPSAPAVVVATPPSRSSVLAPSSPPSTAAVPAASTAAPAARDLAAADLAAADLAAADLNGSAQRHDAFAPPPAPVAATPSPGGLTTIAAAVPWPIAPPSAPRPAPALPTHNLQLASAPPDEPADAAEEVPLPRSRPSRMIAARLAIPLPRPRPQIASDGRTTEQAAFEEREVERMR